MSVVSVVVVVVAGRLVLGRPAAVRPFVGTSGLLFCLLSLLLLLDVWCWDVWLLCVRLLGRLVCCFVVCCPLFQPLNRKIL